MPNPFHYRATIDRLWRRSDAHNPAHIRLAAVCALVRELSPGNPRHDHIQQMLEEANPVEFARHKLRDLYGRADPTESTSRSSLRHPLPLGEGRGEGPLATQEEEPHEEDDDPL